MYRFSVIWLFSIFQRVLYEDMPNLLRETDQDFLHRTGWVYRHDAELHMPNPCVIVQPPVIPLPPVNLPANQ